MPPLNVNIQLAEVSYEIGTQSTIAIAATAIHEALALLLPKNIYVHVKLRKELRMAEVYLRLDIYFGDLLVLEAELTLRPIPMSLIKITNWTGFSAVQTHFCLPHQTGIFKLLQ